MAESLTLWGLLGLLLRHGQKLFVYPSGFDPHPRYVRDPRHENIVYELLELPTPDRVTIECYLMLFSSYRTSRSGASRFPENGRATVIMFHGNAMTHGDVIPLADQFLMRGCNVLTVSYRGYGRSTGTPSESGLRRDAQTALNYLTQHEVLSSVPIAVWGQSLGAAVAIDLVYNNPQKVKTLIIENGFLSIPLLVKDFPQPFGSLSFLCTQRWPSIDRIQKIPKSTAILMLGGDRDQVIPHKHLQGLWAGAQLRPGGHAESQSPEDKEMNIMGCLPSTTSPKKNHTTKSGSEILKTLKVVSGNVDLRNGKDRYRLFAYGRHETTCAHREYWPTVGQFLDDVLGSEHTQEASITPPGTVRAQRNSIPPSTSYEPPVDTTPPSDTAAKDPKVHALAEAHIPLDLPPLPTPITSPTFTPAV